MNTFNTLIVSTAHLHPLEAKVIDKVAYMYSDTCSMIMITDAMDKVMLNEYKSEGLVCLVDFLQDIKKHHNVDAIIFDADADPIIGYRVYDW